MSLRFNLYKMQLEGLVMNVSSGSKTCFNLSKVQLEEYTITVYV